MAGDEGLAQKQDAVEEVVQSVVQQVVGTIDETKVVSKKRRLCRYPGCTKVIKSQGHCQRHGARAKRCKVEGCDKQAQGTHDGMCKRHWKAINFPLPPPAKEDLPPPPEGESVYDSILPQSISYRPTSIKSKSKDYEGNTASNRMDPLDPPFADGMTVMPLVSFLREGRAKAAGWHRNIERRARGMFPVSSSSSQLEPWERQLVGSRVLHEAYTFDITSSNVLNCVYW
mmetsp:Transcript_17075/g.19009  ORF Transcript_17075/g.19009 Transcript_17075/m.19009 type:complete len:228 (+) Transcript_17075:160-843(+)